MKQCICSAAVLLFAALLTASPLPGKNIGPDVSQFNGRELKWESGSRDYFTLHRTMLSRSASGNPNESAGNPQADGCLSSSSKAILPGNLPDDAVVTDAFIIWTTGHTPDNPAVKDSQQYNKPTDNAVTLKFAGTNGVSITKEVVATQAYSIGAPASFEFEGVIHENEFYRYRSGVYTYRVEISDLFNEILAKGREGGLTQDGKAYEGNFTVEGLSCFNGDPYYKTTIMVSNWALFFVYTSSKIKPKKIYVYNGLNYYGDTQSTAFVSGFELPDDPSVRVSLLVSEGDPGLYSSAFDNLEGLLFRADQSQQLLSLSNACNPPASGYTEVYNSISSFYQWDATNQTPPYCIGAIGGNGAQPDLANMEWAVDFDTFLLNNQAYPGYLNIGDKDFEFVVSANQDTVFTNLMIVSVDTKTPKFDIPESASSPVVPLGREKHTCACTTEEDRVCLDRPYYYLIRVQNWGENKADKVTVQDTLPPDVTYVAGSTEMATKFDENGNGINWSYLEDGAGGTFPLAAAYEVAGQMLPCNKVSNSCSDSVLLRFLVQPKSDLPKHVVISNSAVISDVGGGIYKTNSDVSLKVRASQSCPLITACAQPERAKCGGDKTEGGGNDDDPATSLATDAVITFEEGKNSPKSDEAIIVSAPVAGLVLGQIGLKGTKSGEDGKSFKLNALSVKFTSGDTKTTLSNIKLIRDINGNGKVDAEEPEMAASEGVTDGQVLFTVKIDKQQLLVNTLHHLIVTADAGYQSTDVPGGASFNMDIEGASAFAVQDAGKPTVAGSAIKFQDFMLEPTAGFFVITKGSRDPAVPAPDKINANISMMQLRLKAVDGENEITSITIKTAGASYTKLGKGITALSLYLDVDGDGEVHTSLGDIKIAEAKDLQNEELYTFQNISIPFAQGEEKHILVNAVLNLGAKEKARIVIPSTGAKLKNNKSIYKLPISSKEFINACDPADPSCAAAVEEDSNGCSCSITDSDAKDISLLFATVFLSLFVVILIRHLKTRREKK